MNKNNLPWILVNINMTLNNKQMLNKMIEVFNEVGASVIENTIANNSFIVLKKNTNVIKNICSIFLNSSSSIPKIQVIIKFLDNKYSRLVEIKSLQGYHRENETLIINYLKKCIPISKSIKIIDFSKGFFGTIEEELQKGYMEYLKSKGKNIKSSNILSININKNKNKNLNNSGGILFEDKTNTLQKINKHATNYYEIYKILSQDNYEVGRIMTNFINEFKIKNEYIEKNYNRLPEQMKEIIEARNICDDAFSNYFNMGKSFILNDDLEKQTQKAIDNFIFNKLYYQLYELYDRKYQKENEDFLNKKKLINENYNIEQIMEYLNIKPEFRCLESYKNSGNSELCLPFKSTIDNMNKIELEQNPNIKFNTLIEAGLELRNNILGNEKGKKDLNSMDDELPIFIYCSTQIDTKNAPAEYHMIEDYIKYSNIKLDQSKVLTNCIGAILYISEKWDTSRKRKKSFSEEKIEECLKEIKKDSNKKEYEDNEEKGEENKFLEKNEEHKLN